MLNMFDTLSLRSSLISRLPTELLSEIFSLCALSADGGSDSEPTSSDTSNVDSENSNDCITLNPFGLMCSIRLATVCRRWRATILNQASLWADVCVTQEMLVTVRNREDGTEILELDTALLETCLTRSRGYPLNIVIDARDPEWNWTEDGVGQFAQSTDTAVDDDDAFAMDTSEDLMPPLFGPTHMRRTLTLLLPHLHRWKSVSILTDTWAPMHAALCLINPAVTQHGAPMLERVSLMRCNELPSYWTVFQPEETRDPAFLSCSPSQVVLGNALPKLKHIALEGVHADWDILRVTLQAGGTLESLAMRYHSMEVRPTLAQYNGLLSAVPRLRRLAVKCSGARVSCAAEASVPRLERVSLPALRTLALGYQSTSEGESALEMLHAPGMQNLELEDKSHWASEAEGSEDVLAFLTDTESNSATSQPLFPLLTSITLTRVDAPAESLHAFFRAHPNVSSVTLCDMTPGALRALLPATNSRTQVTECAFPALRDVRVVGVHSEREGLGEKEKAIEEARYYLDVLEQERAKCGSIPLARVVFDVGEDADDDGAEENTDSDAGSVEEDDEAMEVQDNAILASALFLQQALKDAEVVAYQPAQIFDEPFGTGYYEAPTLIYH